MYILPLATTVVLTMSAVDPEAVDAYMYSSGPSRVRRFYTDNGNRCDTPSSSSFDSFACSPRNERFRQRQQRINDAFRDLQEEMNGSFKDRRQRRGGRSPQRPPRRPSRRSSPAGDMFMMDFPPGAFYQEVDKEAMKKWVDKALNLASEFNEDFAQTDVDREANAEFIEKSKDWVDRLYEAQSEESNDFSDGINDPVTQTGDETTEDLDDTAVKADDEEVVESSTTTQQVDPEEPEPIKAETPYSENRSNEEMFQVAVDLPGVERADIDISLQADFLTVEAERRPTAEASPGRKYLKKFVLVEDEVEVDQIDATLKNGILIVSAPKKVKNEEEQPPLKININ